MIATYNGDSFDFPFLLARATAHGIDMYKETGFKKDSEDEFKSRSCVHMDCFRYGAAFHRNLGVCRADAAPLQMGQARLVPPARKSGTQGRHRREARLQPHRARPGTHDAVRPAQI